MSGHSKWSKIKHQKGETDAVKGKIFTKLANAIAIAVREGGSSDPATNMKLRFAIDRARAANMPREKIERAIARATGSAQDAHMEYVVYEAFGPGGVGLIIEAATDNKQRSSTAVKNVLDRGGGVLAGTGAVSYLFEFVGLVTVEKNGMTFEQLFEKAAACDALDVENGGDMTAVFCKAVALHTTKECLESEGCTIHTAQLWYRPKALITADETTAKSVERLCEALEDLDDVARVFSNMEYVESV